MKRENAKHIFSHIEWHMKGYRVRLENRSCIVREQSLYMEMEPVFTDLLKNCVWETPEMLEKKYSIPSAMDAYKKSIVT